MDRDGGTFLSLVNYLRNNREVFPKFVSKDEEQMFTKELEFWDMKEDLAKFEDWEDKYGNKVQVNNCDSQDESSDEDSEP